MLGGELGVPGGMSDSEVAVDHDVRLLNLPGILALLRLLTLFRIFTLLRCLSLLRSLPVLLFGIGVGRGVAAAVAGG
jgi:hypothetical protein